MTCPSCAASMTALTLSGHHGTEVSLDICPGCQVIWFDGFESLRLAPSSVLHLFRLIGERGTQSPRPLPAILNCPRCGGHLLATEDRQRSTAFRYHRCERRHGRLIAFFDFLREKDFIRPLSPRELADLKRNIQTVNCSNCGGPIDLASASACGHCGTPISMLDLGQIGRMKEELEHSASPGVDAAELALRLAREEHQVDAIFDALRADRGWQSSSSFGLVESGLWMIAKWLSRS